MTTRGYVLIEVAGEKATHVAQAVGKIDGVTSVHAVTGPYDVIAQIEAPDMKSLGNIILTQVRAISGIHKTLTCVAIDD